MIKLKRIVVDDFGPFKGRHDFDLNDPDLVGIVGAYDKQPGRSNGAGKTFLVEAITFGLYGHGRTALDGLVRRGAPGCLVTLWFDVDGEDWSITRGRGKMEGVVIKGPDPDTLIKGANAAGQWVEETFGASMDTFLATSFFAQGKADMLVAAPPAVRKGYLYEILGLEAFERAYAVASAESSTVADEVLASQAELKAKQDLLEELQPPTEGEVKKTVGELARATSALKQARSALAEATKQQSARSELEKTEAVAVGLIPNAKQAIARQGKVVEGAKSRRVRTERDAEQIRRSLKDPSGLEQELTELDKRRKDQQKLVDDMRKKSAKALTDVERYDEDIQALSGVKGLCPTCKQVVADDYKSTLLVELKNKLHAAKGTLQTSRVSLRPTEQGLDEQNKRVRDLEKRLAAAQAQDEHLAKLQKDIPELEIEHVKARQAKDELEAALKRATDDARKASAALRAYPPVDMDGAQRAVDLALENVNVLTRAEASVKIRAEKAKQLKRDILKVEKQSKSAAAEQEIYNIVKQILGKKGVPALLIDAAVVDMEAAANEMLARLLPGHFLNIVTTQHTQTGKEVETLAFEISDGVVVRAIESFSGGERMLLNFCIRLAVAEAVAVRAERGIGFAVLDEIFGGLDATNKQAVATVLKELQARFPQIIVISHTDIASLFPRVVKVIKGRGGSIIENGKRNVVDPVRGAGDGAGSVPKAGKAGKVKAGPGSRVRNGKGRKAAKDTAGRKAAGKGKGR